MSADGLEGVDALEGAQVLFAADSSRAHNDDAYDQAFLAHYERVVAMLIRLLGHRPPAEEVASEVFWRAYRERLPWSEDRFVGWLYRTATNLGIEVLRSRRRRDHYESAAAQQIRASSLATPLDDVLRSEQAARVRAVLASLKAWQARILILRSSGLSYADLAHSMRLKASSVGTMLARAEAQFQKKYTQMYGTED